MHITEVRFKLVNGKNEKLRAFCSITIDDDFVVRDLKVIDGAKGPFIAMPSRKLMERCSNCGGKNHFRAKFCNECGTRLSAGFKGRGDERVENGYGRSKLHAEIAHPINSKCREMIQRTVLEKYWEELERAKKPDYAPAGLSFDDEDDYDDYFQETPDSRGNGLARTRSRSEDERVLESASVSENEHGKSGRGLGGDKPALDDPGLGTRRQPPLREEPLQGETGPAGKRFLTEESQEVEGDSESETPEPSERRIPEKSRQTVEDSEPEDNFGAGIFP